MAVKTLNEVTEILTVPAVLALAPVANSLDLIEVAPTAFADGIEFNYTGKEIIVVHNTDVGTQTVTLKSVTDDLNRTGDIGAYSMGTGEIAILTINPKGFKSSTGKILVVMSANTVKIGVVRLPNAIIG